MASTVLVVEDDADCRESLADYLVMKGYRVAQAANGKEALDQLKHQDGQTSLILLDLSLPVMNGWEFRDLQIHDSRLADIPVVIVSAERDASDSSLDANAYLEKPLDLRKLGVLLDRFFRFS